MRAGLPTSSSSQGRSWPGMRRCETEKPDQAGLRLGAAPGGAFVADLAARAGRRARKRRDRGRVVVRLALDDDMREVAVLRVDIVLAGKEALRDPPFEDRGVVGVREHRALRAGRVRVADHGEQRLRLARAVDDPVGVEDLVPAVLGVRLREHGELGVGRIAPQRAVGALQVLDLVFGQREAELAVCFSNVGNGLQGPRRHVLEELRRLVEGAQHGLGHAIVQQRGNLSARRPPRNTQCRARCA